MPIKTDGVDAPINSKPEIIQMLTADKSAHTIGKILKNTLLQIVVIACGVLIAIVMSLHFSKNSVDIDATRIVNDAMNNWYDYQTSTGLIPDEPWQTDPLLMQRKLFLVSSINAHSGKKLIEQLMYLDHQGNGEPIDVYIRTTGGMLDDAFAIYDTMQSMRSPVNTYAIGLCHSAGGIVLAGGTGRRYAFPNAIVGVHTNMPSEEIANDFGTARRKRFENFWKSKAKLPDDWYPMTSNKEIALTPAEALKYGIIDEIVSKKQPEK